MSRWLTLILCLPLLAPAQQNPAMYFGDSSRLGRPYAKDPKVVSFRNTYWMYTPYPPPIKWVGASALQRVMIW